MNLLELNFQRRKTRSAASELLDLAVNESRVLTIAEQVRFDSLTARLQELDEATTEREALRKLVD